MRDFLANPAIVSGATAIVIVLLGWVSGFWKWAGAEISKWLEHRRKVAEMTRPIPKKTMTIVLDTSSAPPLWSKHDFGNGRSATDCRTPLLITNLQTESAVKPRRPVVRVRGLNRYRRKAYEIQLTGPDAKVDETVFPKETRSWWIIFMVVPEIEAGETLRADIIIHDEFDNAHIVRGVRFTSGFPDALPR